MAELDPQIVAEMLASGFTPPQPLPKRAVRSFNTLSERKTPAAPTPVSDFMFGNPEGSFPAQVDKHGRPLFSIPLEEFRQTHPGQTHPEIEAGTMGGMLATRAPEAMARSLLSPVISGVATAPKTAAGLGTAGVLGATTSQAGEPETADPEPRRPADIQAKIDAINAKTSPQQKQLDQLKARFGAKQLSQEDYNKRRIPLEEQLGRSAAELKTIDEPFQRQLQQWETRKNQGLEARNAAEAERAEKLKNVELPYRVKYPEKVQKINDLGLGVSAGTALLAGLLSKGKKWPVLGAMGVGGAEGAITSNIPEWYDLGGEQPKGSPAWQKTLDQQISPENIIASLAQGGVHAAGAGAISLPASYIPKMAERVGAWFPKGASAPTGGIPSPAVTAPPASSMKYSDKSGLWHYAQGSGKSGVVPKQFWPPKPTKTTKSPEELAAQLRQATPQQTAPQTPVKVPGVAGAGVVGANAFDDIPDL